MNFEERLRHQVGAFHVGHGDAAENVDVIQHPAVDVSEREERERDIGGRLEIEGGAGVGHVGGKIVVGEHDALGLAGGAGSVDDGAKLAGEDLCGAQTIGGDFGSAGGSDQRLVAQEIGGDVILRIGYDHLFEFGELCAALLELLQLVGAADDDHAGAGMFQDVSHSVGRFVEVDGDGDAAAAVDGEIGGVPLGAIGGEDGHAITGLDAELDERRGEAGYAAQELRRGDGFPGAVGVAKHLRAGIGARVDGVEKSRREGAVGHGLRSLYLT